MRFEIFEFTFKLAHQSFHQSYTSISCNMFKLFVNIRATQDFMFIMSFFESPGKHTPILQV